MRPGAYLAAAHGARSACGGFRGVVPRANTVGFRGVAPRAKQLADALPAVPPVRDGRVPGGDVQLRVDTVHMILHGLLSQEKPGGNLAVRVTARNKGHDLSLPGRETEIWSVVRRTASAHQTSGR